MSGKRLPSLHIEWSPGRVRALNIVSHRSADGASLADVSSVLSGHREAVVGIGRSAVFLKAVSLPKATEDDLRRLVTIQAAQLFPLPADQLAFDAYQTTERTADGWLTIVTAMRADDLRQLNSELKRANLRAVRILPVAFGAMAVAARAAVRHGVVVEQLSSGLAFDIIENGFLRSSRISPTDSDPGLEARRTLLAFGMTEGQLIGVDGLTLPGAVSQPDTALAVLHEAPPLHFELAEDRVREVQKRNASQTWISLGLMAFSLIVATLVWNERSQAQAVITRGQGAWARQLGQLRSIRDTEVAKAQKAGGQAQILRQAFVTGQPLSDIARVVGDQLPNSSWLTTMSVERGKPIQLHATTTNPQDVAACLNNLTATGRFRDVKLVFANSGKISETAVVQYSVTATAIGNLPLPEPEKKSRQRTNAPASTSAKTTEQKDSPTQ